MGSPPGQKSFLLPRHFLQQRLAGHLVSATGLGGSFRQWSLAFRSAGSGLVRFSGLFEDFGVLFCFEFKKENISDFSLIGIYISLSVFILPFSLLYFLKYNLEKHYF